MQKKKKGGGGSVLGVRSGYMSGSGGERGCRSGDGGGGPVGVSGWM